MIEYKSPSINFITLYKDLVAENCDFGSLSIVPFTILPAQGINKFVVPVNIIIDYYSIGSNSSFIIGNPYIINSPIKCMFEFFNNPLVADHSGLLTLPAVSQNITNIPFNELVNTNIELYQGGVSQADGFSRFRIYFTYYIQNLVP